MLSSAPTVRRLLVRALSSGLRTALRLFSITPSRLPQQSLGLPGLLYQVSGYLKALRWPEEDLTSTADEDAGFYPLRLDETFEDERFVISRKLGWGGTRPFRLVGERPQPRSGKHALLTNS